MAVMPKKFNVASNPTRKGSRPPAAKKGPTHMAKAGKKKAANGGKKSYRKAAKNPTTHPKRKRNPGGITAILGSPRDMVTAGVAGLGSALATRQLPQVVLGAGNTGVEGYIANVVTAVASTWLASAFAGPAAGRGAFIGGLVILFDRVLSDNVPSIAGAISLSGVGDATAYSKLGTIRQGYYTHPNLQNPDGSMYVPDPITAQAMAAVASRYPQLAAPMAAAAQGNLGAVNPSSLRRHTANGMLLSSRFQGRFNQ